MVQYFWVVVFGFFPFSFLFFPSIYKKKTLNCALRIIIFFVYISISKSSLNEQFSRFPLGELPLGVSLVTFWLWTLLPLRSLWIFCVLTLSQSHISNNNLSPSSCFLVTKIAMLPLLLHLSSGCSPHSPTFLKKKEVLTFNFLHDKFW